MESFCSCNLVDFMVKDYLGAKYLMKKDDTKFGFHSKGKEKTLQKKQTLIGATKHKEMIIQCYNMCYILPLV